MSLLEEIDSMLEDENASSITSSTHEIDCLTMSLSVQRIRNPNASISDLNIPPSHTWANLNALSFQSTNESEEMEVITPDAIPQAMQDYSSFVQNFDLTRDPMCPTFDQFLATRKQRTAQAAPILSPSPIGFSSSVKSCFGSGSTSFRSQSLTPFNSYLTGALNGSLLKSSQTPSSNSSSSVQKNLFSTPLSSSLTFSTAFVTSSAPPPLAKSEAVESSNASLSSLSSVSLGAKASTPAPVSATRQLLRTVEKLRESTTPARLVLSDFTQRQQEWERERNECDDEIDALEARLAQQRRSLQLPLLEAPPMPEPFAAPSDSNRDENAHLEVIVLDDSDDENPEETLQMSAVAGSDAPAKFSTAAPSSSLISRGAEVVDLIDSEEEEEVRAEAKTSSTASSEESLFASSSSSSNAVAAVASSVSSTSSSSSSIPSYASQWKSKLVDVSQMFRHFQIASLPSWIESRDKNVDDAIKSLQAASTGDAAKTRELTDEEMTQINRAFGSPSSQILVEAFNIPLEGRHVQCLRPGQWLNDEVMNFYFELLRERSERLSNLKCHFFNTFFYTKLALTGSYNYSNVQRWTRKCKVPLMQLDCVFAPIHVNRSHWCLAQILIQQKIILYFDSLQGSDHGCLKNLLRYLMDEAKDKSKIELNESEWTLKVVREVPRQQNGFDCGVFTCKMADYLSGGLQLNFSQEQMPYFRRRMLLELLLKRVD